MLSSCAKCPVVVKICRVEGGKAPPSCPTTTMKGIIDKALEKYDEPQIREFARQASIQEGECYLNRGVTPFVLHPVKTRLEELIEFSQKMGYKRLGLAFCAGVTHEAAILTDILEGHGFEVVSVMCKVGGVPKERIGLKEEEKILIGKFETMCDPIVQAELLNDAATDFNIMLGLCIGHDSLFLRHVRAMTTVFAVKDRVTGHNPMAVLYTAHSYYQRFRNLEYGSPEEMKARLVAPQSRRKQEA